MCLLETNNGWRGVYGQHWDHAVTSPWTEICETHLSAVVWQSRLLSLHLPWHNQQKLWLVGPPVTYTDKLQQPIRAQKGCPDHVCGQKDVIFAVWLLKKKKKSISNIEDWTFWVNVSIAGWVKHMKRRIATGSLQEELYLFKLPAVRHGRHHLCQLLFLALQHPVNMLHRDLRGKREMRC